jgi:small subunit ribosomal protein S2
MEQGMLVKQEEYLEAGIHIGTKIQMIDMKKFVYRARKDGLFVLDLKKVDERLRMAAKMIARYKPEEIYIVASRTYSGNAAAVFASATGVKLITGRFVPGMFTNVNRGDFVEPKMLFVCDPKGERQAVIESGKMGIATIGLCDTDNYTSYLDWVVPCNNKGRRSLALIFWVLARELAMAWGTITDYSQFVRTKEEFEGQSAVVDEEGAESSEPQASAPAADDKPKPHRPKPKEKPSEAVAKKEEAAPAEKKEEAHAKHEKKEEKLPAVY